MTLTHRTRTKLRMCKWRKCNRAKSRISCAVSYQHDANGAMTNDGLSRYEFDAANRLAAVTTGLIDTSPTTRYVHNALGQRLFKTEPQFPPATGDENDPAFMASLIAFFSNLWGGNTGAANPSASEKLGFQYYYDEDGSLLYELGSGGASSTGAAHYVYLPTPSGPMPIAFYNGSKHYAIHTDHLNTPRRLTNSSKQVAWQWAFSAFGDELPTTGARRYVDPASTPNAGSTTIADVTFNLRYPGQYFDKESGLHFNWMRSYSPNNGRYTQADPIGLQGGWNRFAYANSNPVKYADPTGLIVGVDDLIIGGGVLVVGCAMSPGCSAVVTNAVSATVNAVGDAIDRLCKPAIPDTSPGNLCEQLALAEAKAGAGVPIMEGLGDAPRLIALYGPGPWIKKEHKHRCPDGRLVVIHYFTNGKVNVELKFK